MPLFGIGRDKKAGGNTELVLAYLEEAQRSRLVMKALDEKGREVSAVLHAVDAKAVTVGLQGPLTLDKGAKVGLLFLMDGLRFKAWSRVQEAKGGQLVMDLPADLELAERRKKSRARINPREAVTATALTGLFEGIGLTGSVENLSEGGLRLRVEKAMELKDQRKLPLSPSPVSIGQPFMLIRVNKVPKCPPTVEVEGKVAYLEPDGNGLIVGIAFTKDAGPMKAFVQSRAGAVPSTVPFKARRVPEEKKPEPAPAASAPAARPEEAAGGASSTPAPAPAPSPAAAAVSPALEPPPAPEVEENPEERARARMRLKKRARGILVAMPECPEREGILEHLADEGYGRVFFAGTLTELIESLDLPGISLVLVDGGVAELQPMGLLDFIDKKLGTAKPPVILAAEEIKPVLAMAAQRLGVSQILVKPYPLDEAFSRVLEVHLGIAEA